VRSEGGIELREYAAMVWVETAMASRGNGADGSFNRLFRFITGGNEQKQKIAMTTPVFMTGQGTNATMAFVMPATMTKTAVPRPGDEAVSVRQLAGGQYAVVRFSGGRSEANETAALQRLESWLRTQKLPVKSSPVFGYFDPPWTPPFLRRNEVMLPVDVR
jgi:DNA gyrase inhibitor GyrI